MITSPLASPNAHNCLPTAPPPSLRTDQAPLRRHLAARDTGAIRGLRDALTEALHTWGLRGDFSDAAVVTSELLTNAVVHARPAIELCATYGDGLLLIDVGDASHKPPLLAPEVIDGGEGGRGLAIVHAFSRDRGWLPTSRGKHVWALLPVRSAALSRRPTP